MGRNGGEPRQFATADSGLVAWMGLCGIEPVGYTVVGRGRRMAATFARTDEVREARRLYDRTCLYGRGQGQDPDTVVAPDMKPSEFVQAYLTTLHDLQDRLMDVAPSENRRGKRGDDEPGRCGRD